MARFAATRMRRPSHTISAPGCFQVANRHAFGCIFKRDLGEREPITGNRALTIEMIVRFVFARAPR